MSHTEKDVDEALDWASRRDPRGVLRDDVCPLILAAEVRSLRAQLDVKSREVEVLTLREKCFVCESEKRLGQDQFTQSHPIQCIDNWFKKQKAWDDQSRKYDAALSASRAEVEGLRSIMVGGSCYAALQAELAALKERAGGGDYAPSWRQENAALQERVKELEQAEKWHEPDHKKTCVHYADAMDQVAALTKERDEYRDAMIDKQDKRCDALAQLQNELRQERERSAAKDEALECVRKHVLIEHPTPETVRYAIGSGCLEKVNRALNDGCGCYPPGHDASCASLSPSPAKDAKP